MTFTELRESQNTFDGERLALARLFRGKRMVEVAHAIGVSPSAISQYEQGRTRPSESVVAALSLHLRFPPRFFDKGRAVYRAPEAQAHFRSLRSTSKRERERILARVGLIAEIVAEVERHVHLPSVSLPAIPVPANGELTDADRAATEVRRKWGLGAGPIEHVVRLLETKGVIVVRHSVETQDVDAFSTVVGTRPIVILASEKNDAARSRMDAAHELGHLVMHHDAEPGRHLVEQQAQRFAAAFLMPAETILKELPRQMRWDMYMVLKKRWRVSLQALLYRARVLGVLGPDAYQRAQMRIAARGWRGHEPVDIGSPEDPTLLQKALDLLARKRHLPISSLASQVRLFDEDFANLVADSSDGRWPRLRIV